MYASSSFYSSYGGASSLYASNSYIPYYSSSDGLSDFVHALNSFSTLSIPRSRHAVSTSHGPASAVTTQHTLHHPTPQHHAEGGGAPAHAHNTPHHQPLQPPNQLRPAGTAQATASSTTTPVVSPVAGITTNENAAQASNQLSGSSLAAAIITPLLVIALLAIVAFLVIRYRRLRRSEYRPAQPSMSNADDYSLPSVRQHRGLDLAEAAGTRHYHGPGAREAELYGGVKDASYTQAYNRQRLGEDVTPSYDAGPNRQTSLRSCSSAADEEEQTATQLWRTFSYSASEYDRGTEADVSTVSDVLLPSTSARSHLFEEPPSPVSEMGGRFELMRPPRSERRS